MHCIGCVVCDSPLTEIQYVNLVHRHRFWYLHICHISFCRITSNMSTNGWRYQRTYRFDDWRRKKKMCCQFVVEFLLSLLWTVKMLMNQLWSIEHWSLWSMITLFKLTSDQVWITLIFTIDVDWNILLWQLTCYYWDRFPIYFSIGLFWKQSMLYFPCLTFSWNYTQPLLFSSSNINYKRPRDNIRQYNEYGRFSLHTSCFNFIQMLLSLYTSNWFAINAMLKQGLVPSLKSNESPGFPLQLLFDFAQYKIKTKFLNEQSINDISDLSSARIL